MMLETIIAGVCMSVGAVVVGAFAYWLVFVHGIEQNVHPIAGYTAEGPPAGAVELEA